MILSKRLIAAYALDWVVIVGIAAVGGGINFIPSVGRPFSLLDLSISYPYVPAAISVTTLALVCFAAPAIIIALVSLVLVPGKPARTHMSRSDIIRRKLWELHGGLAGLCLATALAFFVTNGLKNMFGKPRPHLLALCQPDLSNIADYVVGGFGQEISARWTLVNKSICQNPNSKELNDSFRSFPSGHASWSWSGLLYFSLYLSSKFAIAIPYLPAFSPATESRERVGTARTNDIEMLPLHMQSRKNEDAVVVRPLYNLAAAPPNYGIVIVLIPLAAATYITSTRYFQFWHFGVDIVGGAVVGIVSAWFSFRWYHTPVGRGAGWAWGARSPERAFGVGVGTAGYVVS